jgi:MFS family permease
MNSAKLEEIKEKVGNNNFYQYVVLFLCTGFWSTCNLMSISLPYLELNDTIRYWDINEKAFKTKPFNYNLCDSNEKYEYLNVVKHSWVIEFGTECHKTETGLIGSATFLGVLVGSLLFLFLADSIGRKRTILIGGVGFTLMCGLFNLANSIIYIYIAVFFLQLFAFFGILGSFLFCMENVTRKRSALYSAVINSGFSLGGFAYIVTYKYINDWRTTFNIAGAWNLFLTILFLILVVDTPNFYLAKGHTDSLVGTLKYIAKFNKKDPTIVDNFISALNDDANVTSDDPATTVNSEKAPLLKNSLKNHSIWSLFKFPSVRKIFLIMCFLWMSTAGTYYGITIYLKNLPGDIYQNGIYIYIIELAAYFISSWAIERKILGRKKSFLGFQALVLLGCILILALVFGAESYLETIFAFIVWFGLSALFNIIFTYSSEVYPTVVKAKGFGVNSVFARVSNIIFPMIVELLEERIIILFAVLSLIAFILVFFLPETLGKPPQNNIKEDMEPLI